MKRIQIACFLMLAAALNAGCGSILRGTAEGVGEAGKQAMGIVGEGAKQGGSLLGVYDFPESVDATDEAFKDSEYLGHLFGIKPDAKPTVAATVSMINSLKPNASSEERERDLIRVLLIMDKDGDRVITEGEADGQAGTALRQVGRALGPLVIPRDPSTATKK